MAELAELTYDTLPDAWRGALKAFHECEPARGGSGGAAWTLEEDALLLHKKHNPRVKQEPWTKIQIGSLELVSGKLRS